MATPLPSHLQDVISQVSHTLSQHFGAELAGVNRRLEQSNTRIEETTTRLEETTTGLEQANTALEQSNMKLEQTSQLLEKERSDHDVTVSQFHKRTRNGFENEERDGELLALIRYLDGKVSILEKAFGEICGDFCGGRRFGVVFPGYNGALEALVQKYLAQDSSDGEDGSASSSATEEVKTKPSTADGSPENSPGSQVMDGALHNRGWEGSGRENGTSGPTSDQIFSMGRTNMITPKTFTGPVGVLVERGEDAMREGPGARISMNISIAARYQDYKPVMHAGGTLSFGIQGARSRFKLKLCIDRDGSGREELTNPAVVPQHLRLTIMDELQRCFDRNLEEVSSDPDNLRIVFQENNASSLVQIDGHRNWVKNGRPCFMGYSGVRSCKLCLVFNSDTLTFMMLPLPAQLRGDAQPHEEAFWKLKPGVDRTSS